MTDSLLVNEFTNPFQFPLADLLGHWLPCHRLL